MKIVRRTLASVALVLTFASTGCTFGAFPVEAHAPTYRALPPCFTGDICGVPFDGVGFAWTRDVIQSVTGR